MGRAAQPRGDGRGCSAERSRSPVDVFSPPPTGGRRDVPILPDPEVGGPTAGSMAEILAVDDVLGFALGRFPQASLIYWLESRPGTSKEERRAVCKASTAWPTCKFGIDPCRVVERRYLIFATSEVGDASHCLALIDGRRRRVVLVGPTFAEPVSDFGHRGRCQPDDQRGGGE